MLEHNALGSIYKVVHDLRSAFPEISVVVHPDDVPTYTLEPFVLTGSASDYLAVASVECMLFPHASEDRVFVPQTSSLYDAGQYPLLFPSGYGGWWKGDSRSSQRVPLFQPTRNGSQKPCLTVAKYVKYVSFQRLRGLSVFSTAYQQWVLDSFSRWQAITFAAMAKNDCVINGMRERVASYAAIQRGDTRGRPCLPLFLGARLLKKS